MAKKKKNFYAVRRGRRPGIYETWGECKTQVHKYPGAVFKGFSTREEAKVFLANAGNFSSPPVKPEVEKPAAEPLKPFESEGVAYVDGSYNADLGVYGSGVVLSHHGYEDELSACGVDPEKAVMRNVAGEIDGAMLAVRKALELGLAKLVICHDYTGIAAWATGEWKAKKQWTREYREFMQEAEKRLQIEFCKVPAHTGIPGNEAADRLAKQAAGIC